MTATILGAATASPYERFIQARDFLQRHRSDYDTAYRDYRAPEFDTFNWALDFFDVQAEHNATPALWVVEEDGSERKISYAEMAVRSSQVANWLRSLGVGRGDRVLLMLPNRVELWEAMLAGIKLGAVLVPTTMLVSSSDLEDRLQRGRVKHVIAQAGEAHKFALLPGDYTRIAVGDGNGIPDGWTDFEQSRSAPHAFAPDAPTRATDPLLLYFTSGTTAKPKLVLHSHQSYPVGHLSTMYWIGLRAGDVHWNISSPGWAKHAWSCFFAPWNAGATVFIFNYARFSARACLETIARCGVTSLCAPPTVWRLMIKEDLSGWRLALRELVGAGEPLNPEVIEQVERAWGIRIRDGYGQSETTCQIGNPPGQRIKPGSMGRPLPGYRVALLDLDDRPAREGEIALALGADTPLGLMLGYENDAAKTDEAMRAGHYHTGDSALVDADGYYFYVGRNDDVFKSSDYRISPFELESVLIEHPDVVEAAIVPSPDPVKLAVPKAYVALRQGVEPTRELAGAILAFARARLAPYQRIRRLEFAELPKTISGKIRRVELRRAEAAQARQGVEYREEDFPD
jgi:acetyl-CoA synthetase